MLYDLLTKIIEYCPDVSQKIITNLACTDCSKEMFGDNEINYFWDLTKNNSTQKRYKQNEDVNILLDNLQTYIYTSHENKCNGTSRNLNLNQHKNILFLNSNNNNNNNNNMYSPHQQGGVALPPSVPQIC